MFKESILKLNRRTKKLIIIFVDYCSIISSFYIASYLLFQNIRIVNIGYLIVIFLPPFIAILFYYYSNLYQNILRFMQTGTFFTLFKGAFFYSIVLMTAPLLLMDDGAFAFSLIMVNFFTLMFLLTVTRLLARWYLVTRNKSQKNIIIYGAGQAGVQISNAISVLDEYRIVAFIDDDPELKNARISDIRVFHSTEITDVISEYDAKEILVAIPSISDHQRTELFTKLGDLPISIRTLPNISEVVSGSVDVDDIRNIEIEDLLQRKVIKPKKDLLQKNVDKKSIFITGAGGSIGSEIARQIINLNPTDLILYDSNEYALYSIEKEIKSLAKKNHFGKVNIIPVLGILDNENSIIQLLKKYSVNTVYHAAAYKHVPLVESNQVQGVKNNIFGSLNVLKASMKSNIDNFVLVSTDKAVRPTSLMGATKRFTEIMTQGLSEKAKIGEHDFNLYGAKIESSKTVFSIVRFGNVLNSSGSVVPLFKEQIRNGGPVTVTDPNVIRFFMSISEAVELVIQAGAMSKGGDIFILDMGEPITILELAKKMIHFAGYQLAEKNDVKDAIEIIYTGLRPGEKLYEELFIDPIQEETPHPKIFRTSQEFLKLDDINNYLEEMYSAITKNQSDDLYDILKRAIPEYRPNL